MPSYVMISEQVRQVIKAAKVSGALNGTIWKNKYVNTVMKTLVYKFVVRPILNICSGDMP